MKQYAASRDDEASEQGVSDVRLHLNAALELSDSLALPPQIGAKIQEIVDLLDSDIL